MAQMDIKDLNFQELLSEQELVTVVGGMPTEGYGSLIDDTTIDDTTIATTTLLSKVTVTSGHLPLEICVSDDLPPYYICLK